MFTRYYAEMKSRKVKTMYITLTDTFGNKVEKAIQIAKENNIPVYFERDGEHGTADLAIVLEFQEAGFDYEISGYKGKYDDTAIRVIFYPIQK